MYTIISQGRILETTKAARHWHMRPSLKTDKASVTLAIKKIKVYNDVSTSIHCESKEYISSVSAYITVLVTISFAEFEWKEKSWRVPPIAHEPLRG